MRRCLRARGMAASVSRLNLLILPKTAIRANLGLNKPVNRRMLFNSNQEVPCLTL